ncbi:MAG: hypothetical protein HZA49_07735 [Planctomycetes bacterium]|nr:hypothetical protein [Planctomycetota bacterium]
MTKEEDFAIHTLHWAEIEPRYYAEYTGKDNSLYAIWPAPVDADACFNKAGFNDFSDLDTSNEFEGILSNLVQSFTKLGTPRVINKYYPSLYHRFFKRIDIMGQLLGPVYDDRIPACIVEFGNPKVAAIKTEAGHPILLVTVKKDRNELFQSILIKIANGRNLKNTILKWEHIISNSGDAIPNKP